MHYPIMKQPTGICIMELKTRMIWGKEMRKIGRDCFLDTKV